MCSNDWEFAAAYSGALKKNNIPKAAMIRGAYIPYMQSTVDFFEQRPKEV
jgi:peptidoglycan-N-acetylglucosamine deacetylase